MAHKCNACNNVYSLSCDTDGFMKSTTEIKKPAEVKEKSLLVCCVYKLPVLVVTPNQTISTGEFKV